MNDIRSEKEPLTRTGDLTPPPQYLTVDEAAKALNLSSKTIRRRIANGQIRSWQTGGPHTAIRIPAAVLDVITTPAAPPRRPRDGRPPRRSWPRWMDSKACQAIATTIAGKEHQN